MTFAGLLLLVTEEGLAEIELEKVVESLMAPRPPNAVLRFNCTRKTGGGRRRPTDMVGRIEAGATRSETEMPLEGTDALGYRLPPDGGKGLRVPARTNERSFHRPLDLGWDCWPTGIRGRSSLVMLKEYVVATNERQFCKPPGPGLGGVQSSEQLDLDGTEM